ncbi:Hypothetical Protein OBI_RACECAR_155 [Arthrobacter phage Racecar]|nr:hypothetical protein PBI_RACECAR_237 [Arthrobacter phage Racecar]
MTEQKPEPKPEEKKNDDKTLFGLINAAASMLEGVTAPAKPEYKRPERPAPSPRQAARDADKAKQQERWDERQSVIEAAVLTLLTELRAKKLASAGETITVKLETESDLQYVTLKAEITTGRQTGFGVI